MEKINELRKHETKRLDDLLEKARKDLVEKKFTVMMGKEKDKTILNKIKKQIARIKTVLVEKEVINEQKNS